jgi:hypothetical protein
VSTITFPIRTIALAGVPSRRRFSSPSADGVSSSSHNRSVTIRLISSGIVRSNDRSPASTCAHGRHSFAATSAPASVEFTSPTTTSMSGLRACTTFSSSIRIFPVCSACDPDPTPRSTSGAGSPSSSKNTADIFAS